MVNAGETVSCKVHFTFYSDREFLSMVMNCIKHAICMDVPRAYHDGILLSITNQQGKPS